MSIVMIDGAEDVEGSLVAADTSEVVDLWSGTTWFFADYEDYTHAPENTEVGMISVYAFDYPSKT